MDHSFPFRCLNDSNGVNNFQNNVINHIKKKQLLSVKSAQSWIKIQTLKFLIHLQSFFRFSFEEDLKAGGTAGDDVSAKLSETIAAKLKKYMTQKDQKHRLQDIDKYQFKTSG